MSELCVAWELLSVVGLTSSLACSTAAREPVPSMLAAGVAVLPNSKSGAPPSSACRIVQSKSGRPDMRMSDPSNPNRVTRVTRVTTQQCTAVLASRRVHVVAVVMNRVVRCLIF